MCEAQFMKNDIGIDHLRRDPGSVLFGARCLRASLDDLAESRVHTEFEESEAFTLS